ncbi:hypothetical protein [Paenibacillus sp. UNC451MF]|uniref:hypothetical protein n=1 Tax=Paenibacillus sp. UNC451MF TaxID=1449063 RepID=UPI0004900442|nr:hypothetical protein [Paenibacillus sp. UNC451MF]
MNLMELRIPQGYAIGYNKFCDVEPKLDTEDSTFLANWHYFTEDLLQIYKMGLKNGKWLIPEKGKERIVIDLGWYPDSSAEGEYILVIVNENWNVLKEKRTKDKYEIKETLEDWLEKLYSNPKWL